MEKPARTANRIKLFKRQPQIIMKDQKSIILAVLCFVLSIFSVSAQVQTAKPNVIVSSDCHGYYEYLPQGYNTTSNKFPVIIFFHGSGEVGDGSASQLTRVLVNGTPKQINQGIFPNYFITNGDTFRTIVISPQFIVNPGAQDVSNVIDFVVSNYRVDINRIYLTGLSNGGGDCWNYAGDNLTYANRVAAMVPICGFSWPDPAKGQIIAAANLAVWATHNNGDPVVPVQYTNDYVSNIDNAPLPPNPLAKKSIFISGSHDAWSHTYDFTYREDGYNVYEWMFRFKRSFTTLPVTGMTFNAGKKSTNSIQLNWQTVSEYNCKGFDLERSTDGNHFTSIAFVNSLSSNNSGATYSFTDANPIAGKNYYRLKQIDLDGKFTYSVIRFVDMSKTNSIAIYPNPVATTLNINTTHSFSKAIFQVFDVSGKEVKRTTLDGNGTISISTEGLASGSYFGKITEGTTESKFNFIKQ